MSIEIIKNPIPENGSIQIQIINRALNDKEQIIKSELDLSCVCGKDTIISLIADPKRIVVVHTSWCCMDYQQKFEHNFSLQY